jgi:hypothetical protein
VDPVEPEESANGADLLDVRLDVPVRFVGAVRPAAPELVVEDDASPRPGQRLECLEVVVGCARAAVEQ